MFEASGLQAEGPPRLSFGSQDLWPGLHNQETREASANNYSASLLHLIALSWSLENSLGLSLTR